MLTGTNQEMASAAGGGVADPKGLDSNGCNRGALESSNPHPYKTAIQTSLLAAEPEI
ncbi:MAG: hypothetical protein RLZZ04_2545, partial [Cyanobacteriota bacterium]